MKKGINDVESRMATINGFSFYTKLLMKLVIGYLQVGIFVGVLVSHSRLCLKLSLRSLRYLRLSHDPIR